jgi:hypothetical protein
MAHPMRGARNQYAPQTPCVVHVEECAMARPSIRGAHRHAPQIKVICGFISVAHHRCATKPKNGAPQIGVLLVVGAGWPSQRRSLAMRQPADSGFL